MKTNILTTVLLLIFILPLSAQEKVIKILAIGNSFSEDAIENYLYDLAAADGQKVIIGNMYIGGASIELHVNNANDNKATYSYRKTGVDGKKVTTKDVSIEQAIKDEQWDYISLQQASPLSGKYDIIIQKLPQLISYVKSLAPKKAKLIYHQTWAYQKDSKHKGFANYDSNQQTMYTDIVNTSKKIAKMKDFSFVVPAGTAIQNARTSALGDHFTRDGYHLQLSYGRFTAACTWYQKIFHKDVRKNTFIPMGIAEKDISIAKKAAYAANKKPYKITEIHE